MRLATQIFTDCERTALASESHLQGVPTHQRAYVHPEVRSYKLCRERGWRVAEPPNKKP